jgi:hypothetical protein
MDAWTSPNHRAFVAWTVHLHHEGNLLAFVLDIIEVPEVSLLVCMMYVRFIHHSFSPIQEKLSRKLSKTCSLSIN